jgi:hypothetical protein
MPKEKRDESAGIRHPFISFLDNFWYHYKWHTIVALVLIFAIVFSTVQVFNKPKYDLYIMYAGGTDVRMTGSGGEESDYAKLHSAVKRYVADGNGDGERTISLLNLYLPSAEQIKKVESINDGTEINYTLIWQNDESFRQNIVYGNYYVCLISEHLYREWTKEASSNPFTKVTDYLPTDAEYTLGKQDTEAEGYVLPGEFGVYLSSTPLSERPGFDKLGEDTVLCLRRYTKASSKVSGIAAEDYYANCEQIFRLMLADKAYG